MKFTFKSNVLAAAFAAAVVGNHEQELDTDDLSGCDIGGGDRSIVIASDEGGLRILNTSNNSRPDVNVSTLTQLEQAIGDALAMKPEDNTEIPADGRIGEYDSPVQRKTYFRKDGGIVVGCKEFTPKGARQVVEFAKAMVAGKKPKVIHTDGSKAKGYRHRVEIYNPSPDHILFDLGNTAEAAHVVKLGALLERFTQKQKPKAKAKPAPKAKPFRIFSK